MGNIVNLLKNKIGVTLFDKVRKKRVILIEVTKNDITCQCRDSKQIIHYTPNGTLDGFPDGMQILVPSRDMSDWDKFAWKKGDVLINSVGFKILFDRWANDTYTGFNAKIADLNDGVWYDTDEYTLASEKVSKSFIAEIEKNLGGKLDLETLTIKKQSKFKDGDIVHCPAGDITDETIFIAKVETEGVLHSYVCMGKDNMKPYIDHSFSISGCLDSLRLATESEKQQLHTALEKGGKAWDDKKKTIIDLPETYNFKPLDYFLAKYIGSYGSSAFPWMLYQYAYTSGNLIYHTNGGCISPEANIILPYNDQTKHLLGTTKEYKG